jgi:hypothetical protein
MWNVYIEVNINPSSEIFLEVVITKETRKGKKNVQSTE